MIQRKTVVDAGPALLDAVLDAVSKAGRAPIRTRNPDHLDIERAAFRHRVQRREDLLMCEVAAGAETHEGIGRDVC
jgi:hypothetical protein